MTYSRNMATEGRRIVVLRSISDYIPLSLEDAITLDAARMSWVKIMGVRHRKNNTCDIRLAITHDRYVALSAGLSKACDIASAIKDTIHDEAEDVIELHWLRGEVECVPVCADDTVFGPHTLVVEWTIAEAFHVMTVIEHSIADVGCIELTRLGRMGQKTMTLAVTLPMAIFDATITKISEGTIRRSVSACLFEAIDQAGQREPPVPHSNDDAEIPF